MIAYEFALVFFVLTIQYYIGFFLRKLTNENYESHKTIVQLICYSIALFYLILQTVYLIPIITATLILVAIYKKVPISFFAPLFVLIEFIQTEVSLFISSLMLIVALTSGYAKETKKELFTVLLISFILGLGLLIWRSPHVI